MKTPTLDQQFLSNLSADQKAQVWNYYLLITNPDIDSDQQVAQICEIWRRAEDDGRLLQWLEFIDYFYTDVDEDALPTSVRRAYLSEYLSEKVGLFTEASNAYTLMVLECPQGQGRVIVPQVSQEPYASASFQQQICKKCGQAYSQHRKTSPTALLPDA